MSKSIDEFLNFDARIYKTGDQYTIHIASPAGDITTNFTLPFSEYELKYYLATLGKSWTGYRTKTDNAFAGLPKEFGGKLFESVFQGEVRGILSSSIERARQENRGLRLRINLQSVAELALLPWEYLYSNTHNRFFALSPDTPVIRFFDLPEPQRPFSLPSPLRILLMVSSPADLQALDVNREIQKMQAALSRLKGEIELDVLKVASLMEMRRQLRIQDRDYHVFHFIGHGGFFENSQEGFLALTNEENRAHYISGEALATYLTSHRALRLVVLNTCQGGRNGLEDPFSGVATSLIQQGIPVVLAMQFPITDNAAIAFSQEFYAALAEGWSVDAAVTEGRLNINSANPAEWGTPVLFTRGSSALFEVVSKVSAKNDGSHVISIETSEREPTSILIDGQLQTTPGKLSAPLPAFNPRPSLEVPTGVVRTNSPFYVYRDSDIQLQEQLVGHGTTTTIRAGRQYGKTSLLMHGIQATRHHNQKPIYFDFQLLDQEQRQSFDALLKYIANEILSQLNLPDTVEQFWKSPRSPAHKFNQFMRSQVLDQNIPLLFAIDEADHLLDAPFKKDFFALIRSWDSLRAHEDLWLNLNLIIVISTHPYLLIDEISQSPFNVGLTIQLDDFNLQQVEDLNVRHGNPVPLPEIPILMELTGGHPYLVRQALYVMVTQSLDLPSLIQKATQNDGPFGNHLRYYRDSLKKRPELLNAFQQIIQHNKYPDEILLDRLLATGLVKEVDKQYEPRCGLYATYFGGK